jgi:hypothetical protein
MIPPLPKYKEKLLTSCISLPIPTDFIAAVLRRQRFSAQELKTERESCMKHFLVTIHADPISRNWRFG